MRSIIFTIANLEIILCFNTHILEIKLFFIVLFSILRIFYSKFLAVTFPSLNSRLLVRFCLRHSISQV